MRSIKVGWGDSYSDIWRNKMLKMLKPKFLISVTEINVLSVSDRAI